LYAVPDTAGGFWDSAVYIGVARNLAAGTGFYLAHILPRTPFTHWAPLYPLILAVPAYFGTDPVDSAKWVNAVAFGLSIFIAGIIAWRCCGRYRLFGILAALLLLFSPDMIKIFSQVLSEGVFIPLLLTALLLVLLYGESGSPGSMLGAGTALSAALLTRYSGAFFFIAVLLTIFTWRDIKQRMRSVILFVLIVVLPSAVWVAHNLGSGGGAVGDRKLLYHRMPLSALGEFFTNLSMWFIPARVPNTLRLLVLMGLLAMILGAVFSAIRSRRLSSDSIVHSALLLAKTCLLFDCAYLVFLCLTMIFLDASERPDERYLSVIYPITALALTASLALWREKLGRQSLHWRLLLTTCVLLLGLNALRSLKTVRDIRQNGIGFQTASWQEKEISRVVHGLPDTAMLYSDDPAWLYFLTRRAPYYTPPKFNIVTEQVNPEFENEMNNLAELGNNQPIVIVLFNRSEDGPNPTASEIIEKWRFHPTFRSTNGTYVLCSSAGMNEPDLQVCDSIHRP
jgi:4-amino-4-deoxy-L-arabinose transferase-like glycosyltransferase